MATTYNACVDLLDRHVDAGRGDHPAVVDARTVDHLRRAARRGRGATAAALRRSASAPSERVAMVMLDDDRVPRLLPRRAAHRGRAGAASTRCCTAGDLGADRRRPAAPRVARASRPSAPARSTRSSPRPPEVRHVVVTGRRECRRRSPAVAPHRRDEPAPPPRPGTSRPAFWLCTPGRPGRPKGVMHRHVDLRATADTYARRCSASAPTTAATRSADCSSPTASATR